MDNLFKDLPLESPEKIIDSIYDKNEKSNIPALEAVLNKNITLDKFVDSLTKEDELTKEIYKERDKENKIIYPLSKESNVKDRYVGNIGDQDDIFHKEDLSSNVKLILNNLDEDKENNIDLKREDMQLITIFSNEGKKYTGKSKDLIDGVVKLSHEDSDKLSAYMATRRFKELGINKEDALGYTAVIYNQENYKNKWNEKGERKSIFDNKFKKSKSDRFIEKYGKENEKMLEKLDKANKGISNKSRVVKSKEEILKGEKIIKTEIGERYTGILEKPKTKDNRSFKQVFKEKKEKDHDPNISQNNNDLSQTDLYIKERRKREEEVKRKRDLAIRKKADDRMNKTFVKEVDRAISLSLMAGNVDKISDKIISGKVRKAEEKREERER